MEKYFAGAFGLVIGLAGIATCYFRLRDVTRTDKWQRTIGRVIERGTYVVNFATLSVPGRRHAPLIRYTYIVNGKEYVNDAINPRAVVMPRHNTLKWAQKQAAGFLDEVTVFYDPENPTNSYLVQFPRRKLYYMMAACLLPILIGLLFLIS